MAQKLTSRLYKKSGHPQKYQLDQLLIVDASRCTDRGVPILQNWAVSQSTGNTSAIWKSPNGSACTCIHGGSFEVEIEDIPHFEIGGWNPNGAYLKTLRLWVDSLGILTGLQFVTEASESQKWGFCEGEHSAELDLRTKEETTAGIKFFLDSNGRNDVGEDTVVVAVQLIEVKKPAPKPKPPKMKKYKISK
ncbi:hypothetical protein ACKRZS_002142 [Fusarium odoratissimum]